MKIAVLLHGSEIEDLTVPKSVLKKHKKFLNKIHTKAKYDLFVDGEDERYNTKKIAQKGDTQ